MTEERADELYRQYEADKAIVGADPELDPAQKDRVITELTDALEEEEARLGIRWQTLGEVEVREAAESGSVEIPKKRLPEGA